MIRLAALNLMLLPLVVAAPRWQWSELPELPQAVGGAFAGALGDQLLVAGGSYWQGAPWVPGSRKIYVDTIYSLTPGAKAWRKAGTLPKPMGYGASFVHGGALWLVGGQDESGALASILRIDSHGVVQAVGKLPEPLMMAAAAHHEGQFYLLGGQPNLRTCLRSANLTDWVGCSPWPGPGRFFSHAVSAGGRLYLAGGADLVAGNRKFLADAYSFHDGHWSRLPDLPVPIQAGFASTQGGMPVVLSGSDGSLAPFEAELSADHPGFSPLIWRFDGARWLPVGRLPYAPVTSTLVEWRGSLVIPGGEDRPAHRSSRVILGRFSND